MNNKLLVIIVGFALALMWSIIGTYIHIFGFSLSSSQADWGTFGDYFGGILNPIFGLGAFLGVLWSLDLQSKQIQQLSIDKQGEEILVVIKEIDARIGELLNVPVGGVVSLGLGNQTIQIHHMVAESERELSPASDAYTAFLAVARLEGSVVEASVRELKNQVVMLHNFLVRYPQSASNNYIPIVDYYIRKMRRIATMLNQIGFLPEDTHAYFIEAA